MIVTYTVIGSYAFIQVCDVEEVGFDLDDPSPSDCFWIIPGTLD